MEINKIEAQKYLVHYQELNNNIPLQGINGIQKYFKQVGCIQYDPLNIVGRNPDLVLQSRISDYKPLFLEDMLYKKRSLIDGWDKMMAIYLTEDWPLFHRMRIYKKKAMINSLRYRNSLEALKVTDKVIEYLKKRGPLKASQIELGKAGKGRWGHKKLAGAAMDYLFKKGTIGIYKKNGTQKVYDLIENLLPAEIYKKADPFKNEKDFNKWLIKRRIGSVGFLWDKSSVLWQETGGNLNNKIYREMLFNELLENKEIIEVKIADIIEKFYINKKDERLLRESHKLKINNAVKFIAPLDNLLWDREMVEKIFNFKYRWEVYTPVKKRKYGYYVLPVLYKNNFIGRFEPEIDKKQNTLNVKNWWWEDNVKITKELQSCIKKSLENFAKYLNIEKVNYL